MDKRRRRLFKQRRGAAALGGVPPNSIRISGWTAPEDASLGQLLGTLFIANASGNWLDPITYSISGTDHDGNRVAVDGDGVERGATTLDFEGHPLLSFTIEADNGTDAPKQQAFVKGVTNVAETPVNSVAPVITGTAQVGQTLTATPGTWTDDEFNTYTYQWEADGTPIGGATELTYLVTSSEIGAVITVVETATNGAGSDDAESDPTDAVEDSASGPAPLDPEVEWTSAGNVNLPTFTIGLDTPVVGDTVQARYADNSGMSGATSLPANIVDSGEASAQEVEFEGDELADGTWYFEFRHRHSGGAWSNWIQQQVDIDTAAPTIDSIAVTSSAGADSTYVAGNTIQITATLTEDVTFTGGPPDLTFDIGGSSEIAAYISGNGSDEWVFEYTVQSGDTDANGISIGADPIDLNGGAAADAATNALDLTYAGLANQASHKVDTTAPTISTATPADNATDVAVDIGSLTIAFSEDVAFTGNVDIGLYLADDTPVVEYDETDISSGIAISGNDLTVDIPELDPEEDYYWLISSGSITDLAGNPFAGVTEGALSFTTEAAGGESTLLTDLVAYWPMDEASGNAIDAHGSNDLTDNNTVGAGSGANALIGGSRGRFSDASSDFCSFSIADNTDLSVGDIDFTFSVWVRIDATGTGTHRILNKYTTVGNQRSYDLSVVSSQVAFTLSAAGTSASVTVTASTFGNLSEDTWYHILAWHDSVNNEAGISVNGTANTTSYSSGVFDNTHGFYIGERTDGVSQNIIGWIDEVGFWKRILTSDEKTALYNSGSGLAYPFS